MITCIKKAMEIKKAFLNEFGVSAELRLTDHGYCLVVKIGKGLPAEYSGMKVI